MTVLLQELIIRTLHQLKKRGKIIVLVTSRYVDCDTIYSLKNGQLVEEQKNDILAAQQDIITNEQAE